MDRSNLTPEGVYPLVSKLYPPARRPPKEKEKDLWNSARYYHVFHVFDAKGRLIGFYPARSSRTILRMIKEFPSAWTNIPCILTFKGEPCRGLRASMSPGSTLTPQPLRSPLRKRPKGLLFRQVLIFPTWNITKYTHFQPACQEDKKPCLSNIDHNKLKKLWRRLKQSGLRVMGLPKEFRERFYEMYQKANGKV